MCGRRGGWGWFFSLSLSTQRAFCCCRTHVVVAIAIIVSEVVVAMDIFSLSTLNALNLALCLPQIAIYPPRPMVST